MTTQFGILSGASTPPPDDASAGAAAPSPAAAPAAAGKPVINAIVADDHAVVLYGVSKVLEKEPDIRLVAAVGSIAELMTALERIPCDVLICDYQFEDDPHPDGLQLLARLHRLHPKLRVLLLTSHDDMMVVRHAMRAGVAGFLSKSGGEFNALPHAIRTVHDNQRYLGPPTIKAMVAYLLSSPGTVEGGHAHLSCREMEVVRLFASGMTVTEIARHTNRSLKTISSQKKSAMKKLGAANDVELIEALRTLI